MFKQTETKYRTIMLGFGTGSIYDYGCYLISLCNGLNQKGYSFTPESLNDLFKANNAWVGPYKNYIDVANLNRYFPSIFESFQSIDPWNDVPKSSDLISANLIVLGRVSGKAIGGIGDHFVLLTGVENGIVIIHDPWAGKTEKITVRWGNLGNVLGIRIFKIKLQNAPTPPPADDHADDLTKMEQWDKVSGYLGIDPLDKAGAQKAIAKINDDLDKLRVQLAVKDKEKQDALSAKDVEFGATLAQKDEEIRKLQKKLDELAADQPPSTGAGMHDDFWQKMIEAIFGKRK